MIIRRLNENEQYKGYDLINTRNGYVDIRKDGKFIASTESITDARDYIDVQESNRLPQKVDLYVVYAEDTYESPGNAMYVRKHGKPAYCREVDAALLTDEDSRKLISDLDSQEKKKSSKKPTLHKWVRKKVKTVYR